MQREIPRPSGRSTGRTTSGDSPHQRSSSCRALWAAVVLQAQEDIRSEPLDSVNYAQAVHFFIGAREWADARARISDHLDMHRDDLEACGRRCINERRAAEGLDPLPPRSRPIPEPSSVKPIPSRPVSKPRPVHASPNGPATPPVASVPSEATKPYERRPKPPNWRNPFFPNGVPGLAPAAFRTVA